MLKIKKNNPDKVALLLLFVDYIFYFASLFLSDLSGVSGARIGFYLAKNILFWAFYTYCFFDENKIELYIRVFSIFSIYGQISNIFSLYIGQWSIYWMSMVFSVISIAFSAIVIFETFRKSRKLSIAGLVYFFFSLFSLITSHVSNCIRYMDYTYGSFVNPYKDIGNVLNIASGIISAVLIVYVYFKYYKKKHFIKREAKQLVSVEKNIVLAEETLESIKEQFDNGEISEEEYNRKKTEIINAL